MQASSALRFCHATVTLIGTESYGLPGEGLFEDHSTLIEGPSSGACVNGGGRGQPRVHVAVVVPNR